jgi:hypothetical protein
MTTLDYASFFENEIRPRRRRRRLMMGVAAAIVWVLPVLYVGVVGIG